MAPLKVAVIVADQREALGRYELPEPYFGPAPTALFTGLARCSDLELHVISCVRRPVSVPERLADNTFFHALRVPSWAFLRTGHLPALFAIRRKLRELRPHVVHGQGTESYYALGAVHSGFPNLITIHGNMRQVARALNAKPFSFHRLTAHLESWALKHTGGVVCLSSYTQQQVGPLARQTWLVPNAVNDAYYQIEPSPAQEPQVLCVANISPYKNQNALIRTLDPIAAQHGVRLIFLGHVWKSQPYDAEFLRMVASRAWCSYEGFQEGEKLRSHFRTARMLVLPTFEDNCPMVVLEALAAGVPVAASRIGGIPDLIEDGVNGLLFDPRNPDEVRAAVVKMLQPETAQAFAAEGRKRARERYHPLKIARRHIEIYREVMQQDPVSARS